jgi:GT2 family glycosyltransferase
VGAPPQCAVVIPTYDGAHLLSTCLEALLANPPSDCEWRIVVVDDASRDRTPELLAAYGEAIVALRQPRNTGFAHACNAGARAAGDVDHLVFLNNDTVPVAGWLDALVAEAAAHPAAAAVGAKLLFPDGTVQHAGVAIGHDGWPHHLYTGFPGEHPAVERAKRVTAATAACLLVRRAAWEATGGFDTAFHNGYEDVDLCLRLGEAGHEVRYCPRSVVYHLESVTRWADEAGRDTSRNDRLYRERWGDRAQPDDVEHYLADGLIDVEYGPYFPLRLAVSPLLATVQRDGEPVDRIEQLLATRSAQVMELQAQRTRAVLAGTRAAPLRLPSARPVKRRSGGEPRVLHRGAAHRLGAGQPRHLVSVLMPLMDAAEDLREILPLLLAQAASTELEVVAVDSASRDDTVAVLAEFGATVIAIDPAQFDHGLTRNLAAQHARGDVLVFLNGRTRPAGPDWLAPLLAALDADPTVAGACSRIAPHPDADPLTRHDGAREPSGSDVRAVKRIDDWSAYRAMGIEQRRVLLNFHTVSAAIRADVLRRIPFRSVRAIGEDLLWSREVLEAGMALVHEPASLAYHSHAYSLREWLMRNVDDGIANREINERSLAEDEAEAMVRHMIAEDWRHLRDELGLEGEELERWQIQAALRRAAQVAGQWLGVNHAALPPEAIAAFSRVEHARRES